jgi:hypothetical protein
MCALFVARAIGGLPRLAHVAIVVIAILCAIAHAAFLIRFDNAAKNTGLLRIDSSRVMIRRAPGEAFSLTMREVRSVSREVSTVIADGATALQSVHGLRGELWRESGAEFMPWAAAPQRERPTHFMVAGPNAAPVKEAARVLGNAVCAGPRDEIQWRGQHRGLPGWETTAFSDQEWFALPIPRRTEAASLAADNPRFSEWRTGRLVLRGRYAVRTPGRKRFIAITTHSPPGAPVSLTEFFMNGVAITPSKSRVMYGIYLNQEWLVEITNHVSAGESLIAIGVVSTGKLFDIDVFEVPCTDSEFYF